MDTMHHMNGTMGNDTMMGNGTGHHGHGGNSNHSGNGNHGGNANHSGNGNHGTTGGHGNIGHGVFEAGNVVELLFNGWTTTTDGELFASCIAFLVMAFLYEGLKVFRQLLLKRSKRANAAIHYNGHNGNEKTHVHTHSSPLEIFCSCAHFFQTFLHMVQIFVGYLLMLAFMTFNAWICIAIIVGSGLGYLVLGWKYNLNAGCDHCN